MTSQGKSISKDGQRNNESEYLANDLYSYHGHTHYDIELLISRYRLPQPSPYSPLKTETVDRKK